MNAVRESVGKGDLMGALDLAAAPLKLLKTIYEAKTLKDKATDEDFTTFNILRRCLDDLAVISDETDMREIRRKGRLSKKGKGSEGK